MPAVNAEQRRLLERVVGDARDAAEKAADAALKRLAVDRDDAFPTLSEDEKALRRQLRAEVRRLGNGSGGWPALVAEVAYEHWHRMLFARFLAENGMLVYDESGTPITLEDCAAIAEEQGERDRWAVAARYAAAMLPGVFRLDDPALKVRFARDEIAPLEKLLERLPAEIFQADDSLGWVYQFWQARAKSEVNESGRKIGGADISPVTQLFTEHYMVQFLLHNSLGAWWAARHPDSPLVAGMTYLRRTEDGQPAAGAFPGWPSTARELRVLDPCCGSGHFLVAAFALLRRFRMEEEGLSEAEAGDAVLRENLFGLELDPRCTQIAAFALALAAWKHGRYRPLPLPRVACSGIRLGGTADDWRRLAGKDGAMQAVLFQLRDLFAQAPDLGSLIDPAAVGLAVARPKKTAPSAPAARAVTAKDGTAVQQSLMPEAGGATLFDAPAAAAPAGAGASAAPAAPTLGDGWSGAGRLAPLVEMEKLLPKLTTAAERFAEEGDLDAPIFGEAVQQAVQAVRLLAGRYHLVVTNVPYLARGRQSETLRAFSAREYPEAKADLATVFIRRCLQFCEPGGSTALVTPQNWLFLGSYAALRGYLLRQKTWNVVARLGPGAFETISGEVVNVGLFVLTNASPRAAQTFAGLDAVAQETAREKDNLLRTAAMPQVAQRAQLDNPDCRIALDEDAGGELLEAYATAYQGIKTGDDGRYRRNFWEVPELGESWRFYQSTVDATALVGGCECVIDWRDGGHSVARLQGLAAWGKFGVAVSQMRELPCAVYLGEIYDSNMSPIVPNDPAHLPAIWCFCSSPDYQAAVRRIDQALKVTNATLVKVPFDLAHWQKVAAEKYPDGLPAPHSDDPTQWLFHGHPARAAGQPGDPLQVAVARLLGYRWPRQTGAEIPDAGPVPDDGLDAFADADGIVCLPAVLGEPPAAERLRQLLAAAYAGAHGHSATEAQTQIEKLLAEAGFGGKTLADWLEAGFFAQHARRFHNRPFLWQIGDGARGGFSAIVNYHRLDRPALEKLAYTYLGDWIVRQRAEDAAGTAGANARLVAAQNLQKKLQLILDGEPPFDIYVRWKRLAEQPLGWEPDLNDGVRLNIRPFVEAGVLRAKFTVNWNKDRGTNPDGSERRNDVHRTLAEKRAAQETAAREAAEAAAKAAE